MQKLFKTHYHKDDAKIIKNAYYHSDDATREYNNLGFRDESSSQHETQRTEQFYIKQKQQ